jgi:hypothetical protein
MAKSRKRPKPAKPPKPRKPRSPLSFKRRDLARAIRGAEDTGMSVGRVEIDRSGKIVIVPKSDAPQARNTWDEILPDAEDPKRTP